jgi:endonuclease/exonuclease/phosphatase family metal-dependent hydrolase
MSSAVLRIGTWNVEYALTAANNDRRRRIMRTHPADIWILTETRDHLRPGVGYSPAHSEQRPYYGSSVKARSRWISIWSRYPIIRRAAARNADRERTTTALIKTPLGPLLVYGTVLPWNGDKGRYGQNENASGWSEHHRVIPLQTAEWRYLRATIPNAHLCIAGDLNTDMDTGRFYGTKRGIMLLRNAMKGLRLYCPTNDYKTAKTRLEHRPIDHILLPRAWKHRTRVVFAWEGRIGSPRMSDHSGLVVQIK